MDYRIRWAVVTLTHADASTPAVNNITCTWNDEMKAPTCNNLVRT